MPASKAAALPWAPSRAEIIYIQHSPQVGKEMPNEHPMLVISAREFAEKTGIVVGFPMTHSAVNRTNPFAVETKGPKGEESFVLVHQPKSFDWRLRGARSSPLGGGHTKLLEQSLALFNDIFNICDC